MQTDFSIFHWMVLNIPCFFYERSRQWFQDKISFPPDACREAPWNSFKLPKHAVLSWWSIYPSRCRQGSLLGKKFTPKIRRVWKFLLSHRSAWKPLPWQKTNCPEMKQQPWCEKWMTMCQKTFFQMWLGWFWKDYFFQWYSSNDKDQGCYQMETTQFTF